ncbi:Hypothetical protein FKW44_003724 [Caligus rogercresseyi]|uniref:Uncharacterized protein n=1 Tax=Caligus rogercresseyi TaxID=217165 RepID=A0A7T8KM10_CALRO|nr:Hypothetical protein FKW44_003724 [Caligus rogercresseyi]
MNRGTLNGNLGVVGRKKLTQPSSKNSSTQPNQVNVRRGQGFGHPQDQRVQRG